MCTAVTYKTKDFYFGRTLDNDCSYHEEITITPRNYPFYFLKKKPLYTHYAILGMAHIEDDFPLYYDAVNEKGLCMAGLNFVGNAKYHEIEQDKDNIAQFELIPWLLSQCATVKEARVYLDKLNIMNASFKDFPVAQLHWLLSDRNESITIESMEDGIHIFDNPVGILTNNPPFEFQMMNLNRYMTLSAHPPKNTFSSKLDLKPYSRGMGAIGLPGDLSSTSRFVRIAFTKLNSVSKKGEKESISQFFHILNTVNQPRGCNTLEKGAYEITVYSTCCNADQGIYYYTTYENHQISAVDMRKENLDSEKLISYPLNLEEQILFQNG